MIEYQKEEFKKYGCMSRAIMEICGLPSIEDFCASYSVYFREEYFGMPKDDKLGIILSGLGFLGVSDEWDFEVVRGKFDSDSKVIVLSHVSLNEGDSSELNHASVLHSITPDSFQLWTSFQDGSSGFLPSFSNQFWVDKKCHGLCLVR
jgi:hypothetical protein